MSSLPFSFPEGTKEVPLPLELLNEPYAMVDNGFRPEIVVRRSNFYFDTGRYMGGLALQKKSTRVSVLNIYDTYGLNITLSFLKYIWEEKREPVYRWRWLHAYVAESCAALGYSPIELPNNYEAMILLVVRHLVRLDEKYPKVIESDVTISLPLELVARITGSERLSKAVSKEVWRLRCIPPLPCHLLTEGGSTTTLDRDGIFSVFAGECTVELEVKRDKYTLTVDRDWDRMPDLCGVHDKVVAASLWLYYREFETIGCNADKHIGLFLDSLASRFSSVGSQNIEEACAWLVQLTADNVDGEMEIRMSKEVRVLSEEELRDELASLIKESRLLPLGMESVD